MMGEDYDDPEELFEISTREEAENIFISYKSGFGYSSDISFEIEQTKKTPEDYRTRVSEQLESITRQPAVKNRYRLLGASSAAMAGAGGYFALDGKPAIAAVLISGGLIGLAASYRVKSLYRKRTTSSEELEEIREKLEIDESGESVELLLEP